jgi:hypothetical protein
VSVTLRRINRGLKLTSVHRHRRIRRHLPVFKSDQEQIIEGNMGRVREIDEQNTDLPGVCRYLLWLMDPSARNA